MDLCGVIHKDWMFLQIKESRQEILDPDDKVHRRWDISMPQGLSEARQVREALRGVRKFTLPCV
jgi:hypothetical protein